MNDSHVCGCAAALAPEEAECRSPMPARAGMDGTRRRCVSQRRGLQGHASIGAARREA